MTTQFMVPEESEVITVNPRLHGNFIIACMKMKFSYMKMIFPCMKIKISPLAWFFFSQEMLMCSSAVHNFMHRSRIFTHEYIHVWKFNFQITGELIPRTGFEHGNSEVHVRRTTNQPSGQALRKHIGILRGNFIYARWWCIAQCRHWILALNAYAARHDTRPHAWLAASFLGMDVTTGPWPQNWT